MARINLKIFSPALQTKTNVTVLIPTPEAKLGQKVSFDECVKSGPLPVLYLLHGGSGDEDDYVRFSRIEDYARKHHVLVVMPECENSCYRDTPAGKAYATYVTEELRTMINWMFPTMPDRANTFIAGLSMGGFGAFRLGLSRHDLYSYVGCMSGGFEMLSERLLKKGSITAWAFDLNEDLEHSIDNPYWLASKLIAEEVELPQLYICCGTEDFLYKANRDLKAYLETIGLPFIYHEQPGAHNWDFWDDELKRILAWLPIHRKGEAGIL